MLWVDKRTSQVLTYSSVLSSITSCVASLLLANVLLPRFGRRSLTIGVIVASALVTGLMPFIPTHYSFNAAVPSTSTLSPTTGIHLYLYLFVAAGFFGIPQLAMLLLTQVMLLDIVRDDEKTSAFSLVGASVTLGMAASTFLIRFVLPYFGVSFSTLNHTGHSRRSGWYQAHTWLLSFSSSPSSRRLEALRKANQHLVEALSRAI